MGFQLQDLDSAALVVAAVIGLVSVLTPLVNLVVKSLKDFQFGRPRLLAVLAEVASLGTLLAVFKYRNSLHHLPPFWMLLLGFFIAVLVLVVLDASIASRRRNLLAQPGSRLPASESTSWRSRC